MNPTNVTINFSPKVKKELTPEQQKKNNFMKLNPLKKWEFVYEMLMKHDEILMGHKEMLMDHEERISALEPEQVKTYKFKSYSDEKRTSQYASGVVEVTGETKMLGEVKYAEVKVTENTVKEFVGKKYYVKSDAQCSKPVDGEYHVYQLYEYDEVEGELKKVDVWVTIYE